MEPARIAALQLHMDLPGSFVGAGEAVQGLLGTPGNLSRQWLCCFMEEGTRDSNVPHDGNASPLSPSDVVHRPLGFTGGGSLHTCLLLGGTSLAWGLCLILSCFPSASCQCPSPSWDHCKGVTGKVEKTESFQRASVDGGTGARSTRAFEPFRKEGGILSDS